MNIIDIFLLVCFVPGIVMGISKGFMVQACTLVGFVASVWCAWKFASMLSGILTPHVDFSPAVVNTISFALILIFVAIAFALLGKLLAKLMKVVLLGWLDKLLGIILASLVTLCILGVIIFVFDSLDSQWHIIKSDILQDSVLYQGIKNIALIFFPYLKQLITAGSQALPEAGADADTVSSACFIISFLRPSFTAGPVTRSMRGCN